MAAGVIFLIAGSTGRLMIRAWRMSQLALSRSGDRQVPSRLTAVQQKFLHALKCMLYFESVSVQQRVNKIVSKRFPRETAHASNETTNPSPSASLFVTVHPGAESTRLSSIATASQVMSHAQQLRLRTEPQAYCG
jgi:hypothetical protein